MFSEAVAGDLERSLSAIQGCMTSFNPALTLLFFASGHSDRYAVIAVLRHYGYIGLANASASELFLSCHAFRRVGIKCTSLTGSSLSLVLNSKMFIAINTAVCFTLRIFKYFFAN